MSVEIAFNPAELREGCSAVFPKPALVAAIMVPRTPQFLLSVGWQLASGNLYARQVTQ